MGTRRGTANAAETAVCVAINAHLLAKTESYRRAGIHQYIYQTLQHLPSQAASYLVFTRFRDAALQQHAAIKLHGSRWPTEKRSVRILWEQLRWPLLARQAGASLLHSMAFVTPVLPVLPSIVTVYDLSFMHYPDRFPLLQRHYLQSQARRSCRRARRVITISRSGREDVHRLFDVPLSRIDVVMPGVDPAYRPLPAAAVAEFRQRHRLPPRFLLHVGTLQPRKNIPTLLQALAQLPDRKIPLVLVGGKGWLFDEIFARVQALGLQDRVHFTGYVPDDALPFWYNAATLLVFPSVYEGFGLPVVEAMACGTPVVAANTSSIPEAAGDAGLLFPPQDPAALVEQITAVLQDHELAAEMRGKGLQQAASFSWARAGQETGAVYRRAAQGEP